MASAEHASSHRLRADLTVPLHGLEALPRGSAQVPIPVTWSVGQSVQVGRLDEEQPEAVGRLYWQARATFHDAGASEDLFWIYEAVVFGVDEESYEDLSAETWWRLVMAALMTCPDDDDELNIFGDTAIDHLAGRPGMIERLPRERLVNPRLDRLFEVRKRDPNVADNPDAWYFRNYT